MSMGGGIRPESPTVATRRRAESRRTRSAVQRERTEWKFLIHQPRVSAPVQPRSFLLLLRTGPDLAQPSSPRPMRSPALRAPTSIIFSDQAFDLRASGYGRIQSVRPSMDTAGQNRKVTVSDQLRKECVQVGSAEQREGGVCCQFLAVPRACSVLICDAVLLPVGHLLGCTLGTFLAAPAHVATPSCAPLLRKRREAGNLDCN